jgi:CHAD domain-containing protein
MPKASEVRGLTAQDTTHEAAVKVLWTRFEDMWSFHVGVTKDFDEDDIHDMRVASRRLRTAMQTFRPCFPRKSYGRHYDRIKVLADLLGEVRDRDVLTKELQGDRERLSDGEGSGVDSLVESLKQERKAHRQELKAYLEELEATAYDREFLAYLALNM